MIGELYDPTTDTDRYVHIVEVPPAVLKKRKGPTPANKARASDRFTRRIKRMARLAGLPLRVWARQHRRDLDVATWMDRKGVR